MRTLLGAAPVVACLVPLMAAAQIVTDGTVGARLNLRNGSAQINISSGLGLQIGPNLLQSFSVFNVQPGETATFLGVGGIQHIIARVTGGLPSEISGTLRSTITSSSLYLINPAGIVIGPTASISIPGAFYASTAHYLRLADGTRIDMRAAPGVVLTSALPSAFGFEGAAAAVTLNGAQLRALEGRRIGIVAGDIAMSPAGTRASTLTAPSGVIDLVATRSAGEAVIAGNHIDATGFTAMGNISLTQRSIVNVNEGPARGGAGSIDLSGGAVTIDHSDLESQTRFAAGRGISVAGARSILINGGNLESVTVGAGNAGPLTLQGGDITLSGGALVDTSNNVARTAGNAGPLTVNASGTLTVSGDYAGNPTYLVSNTFGAGRSGAIDITAAHLEGNGYAYIQSIPAPGSTGDGGSIALHTGSIHLSDGSQVDVSTQSSGRAGTLTVDNRGAIVVEGLHLKPDGSGFRLPSGFFSNSSGAGAAGSIVISTATLDVLSGAEVATSAFIGATGSAGTISIQATGDVRVDGYATIPGGPGIPDAHSESAIASNAIFGATGTAGTIDIAAHGLTVDNSGRIQSQTEGSGAGGAVRVRVDSLTLDHQGQIASIAGAGGDGGSIDAQVNGTLSIRGTDSGLFAQTQGAGRGGAIRVAAGDVSVDGGAIFAGTKQRGDGGSIDLSSTGAVTVSNAGRISTESQAQGRAGDLRVTSNSLTLDSGGTLSSQAGGSGDGGSVAANVTGTLTVRGAGSGMTARTLLNGHGGQVSATARDIVIEQGGGLFAGTQGSGAGGDVAASAASSIAIRSGGSISTESLGTGFAGNIAVAAGDSLTLDGGGRITTAARSADGGNIGIVVGRFASLASSSIETAVGTGQGNGGNVSLQVPTLVMLSSVITANAYGGNGGNIHLATTTFIPSADSAVTASSTLGIDGTITLDSPALNPTAGLLVPPPAFLDVGAILAGRCGPRLAGLASSLVIVPRGSVALAPDAWPIEPAACVAPSARAATGPLAAR